MLQATSSIGTKAQHLNCFYSTLLLVGYSIEQSATFNYTCLFSDISGNGGGTSGGVVNPFIVFEHLIDKTRRCSIPVLIKDVIVATIEHTLSELKTKC